MEPIITGLNKHNFHGVVNLAWQILNDGDSTRTKTRAEAEEYVKNPRNKFRVLEINNEVQGMYSYRVSDVNTISFFGLYPAVRKKRIGYTLYKDMFEYLTKKPTFVVVYDNNERMKKVMDKRAEHIGKFLDKDGEISNYYMINFKDKGWN